MIVLFGCSKEESTSPTTPTKSSEIASFITGKTIETVSVHIYPTSGGNDYPNYPKITLTENFMIINDINYIPVDKIKDFFFSGTTTLEVIMI